MNNQLANIINAQLPAFHANIRNQSRKEWASAVRKLFKEMNLTGISVTTPNYSQAETISIILPSLIVDETAHQKAHDLIWSTGGASLDCPECAQRWQAKEHVEKIILAAFPDLNNRGNMQEDYHDYCLSFE